MTGRGQERTLWGKWKLLHLDKGVDNIRSDQSLNRVRLFATPVCICPTHCPVELMHFTPCKLYLNLSKLRETVEDTGARHATVHGVTKNWTQHRD